MKRKTDNERGASLVEFAIILPVFMALVLGTFSGGLIYNRKMQLTHAAREGARYGATLPETDDCSGIGWDECVRSVVVERAGGEVTTGDVCVALVSGNPGTAASSGFTTASGTSACYSDGNGDAGKRVQVRISRPGNKLEVLFFSADLTLTSSATAKYEAGG